MTFDDRRPIATNPSLILLARPHPLFASTLALVAAYQAGGILAEKLEMPGQFMNLGVSVV